MNINICNDIGPNKHLLINIDHSKVVHDQGGYLYDQRIKQSKLK